MPTLTLGPNGDNNSGGTRWKVVGTTYAYQAVDEASADDADYLWADNTISDPGVVSNTFTFPDHSTESGTINSVKVYARCWCGYNGSPSEYAHIYLWDETYGTKQSLTTSAALYSQTWTTNPVDSQSWEWADIDALSLGIVGHRVVSGGKDNSYPYCSQLYVVVDYTLPASGWANIKNIRMGTGSITATDIESVWFGTSQIVVADFDQFNGVTV